MYLNGGCGGPILASLYKSMDHGTISNSTTVDMASILKADVIMVFTAAARRAEVIIMSKCLFMYLFILSPFLGL